MVISGAPVVIDGATAVVACEEMGAPAPAPAKQPSTPLSSEATDQWFSETDACVQRAGDALSTEASSPAPPGWVRSAGRSERPRTVVPLTRMETLQRKLLRRARIGLLLLVALVGAQLGIAFAERMMTRPLISPSVRTPAPPQLPREFVVPLVPEDEAAVPPAHDQIPSF